MSGAHTDIGPELRRLAQSILDGIDPGVRAAAMTAISGGAGKCQQVWCPVCALAAVVTGEQHPLVTIIANHSVALLEVVRAIVADIDDTVVPPEDDVSGGADSGGPGADGNSATGDGTAKTRYQPIPVTLHE